MEGGCGSGLATIAFVARARDYVAIDPSAELIAIARRELAKHASIQFIVGAFEEAEPGSGFDLLLAAQSFHWIDSSVGLRRASELLVAGGRIALFWNFVHFDGTDFLRKVRDVIVRHAKEFEYWPDSSDERYAAYGEEWKQALEETGFFSPANLTSFAWSLPHSMAKLLAWMGTLSWFRVLSPATRASLVAELRDLGRSERDTLEVPVRSLLVSAEKRDPQPAPRGSS